MLRVSYVIGTLRVLVYCSLDLQSVENGFMWLLGNLLVHGAVMFSKASCGAEVVIIGLQHHLEIYYSVKLSSFLLAPLHTRVNNLLSAETQLVIGVILPKLFESACTK